MPNYKELVSILNLENVSPAVSAAFDTGCTPGCTVTTCSCTDLGFGPGYWSSTSYATAYYAWSVVLGDGDVEFDLKVASKRVWAVRGGS